MKFLNKLEGVSRSAAGKKFFAEEIAVLAGQAAVFLEILDRVGIEHFAPDIRVVSGRITAGEGVREIKAAITRRHRRIIDAGFLQRLLFKRDRVGRNLDGSSWCHA